MNSHFKRALIAAGVGSILGIFCIIGQAQRMPSNPLPNETIYLFAAWYNRVIMGFMIGFAGGWKILENNKLLNAVARGAILGVLVSVSFGLIGQRMELMFFFAGILWGILIDTVTTGIMLKIAGNP